MRKMLMCIFFICLSQSFILISLFSAKIAVSSIFQRVKILDLESTVKTNFWHRLGHFVSLGHPERSRLQPSKYRSEIVIFVVFRLYFYFLPMKKAFTFNTLLSVKHLCKMCFQVLSIKFVNLMNLTARIDF